MWSEARAQHDAAGRGAEPLRRPEAWHDAEGPSGARVRGGALWSDEGAQHPGAWCHARCRSVPAPACGGWLPVWNAGHGRSARTIASHPEKGRSGGVGGHLQKQIAEGARVAPHAHPRRSVTSPPRSAAEGSAAASDAPAAAGAADGRFQHTEGSGWSGCRSVSEASARQTSASPATAPRTATARATARCLRGRFRCLGEAALRPHQQAA